MGWTTRCACPLSARRLRGHGAAAGFHDRARRLLYAGTLHADCSREALERGSTLPGSKKNVSPRDAVRMIVSPVDLLVQIQILYEIRWVTSIARLGKKLQDGEPVLTVLWQYDETAPA
jgi:hypothetical protein